MTESTATISTPVRRAIEMNETATCTCRQYGSDEWICCLCGALSFLMSSQPNDCCQCKHAPVAFVEQIVSNGGPILLAQPKSEPSSVRIQPLGYRVPFDIPTEGWAVFRPIEGLNEAMGAHHTIYGAMLPTGLRITAMLGPATLMVTIADGRMIWDVPEPWATDVMMAARKSIRANEKGSS